MAAIRLDKVEKWFGDTQVIKGVDLQITDGELVIFVGPSGCGKSTLLRLIAGLEETSRGRIFLDEKDVTSKVPSERELSMVFQSYALYPHMSVGDNMGFGLKTAGESKRSIAEKVNSAADVLKLEPYLDRRPKELSGGQRQRVAIGRAIVRQPKGFLFDEPLSNLDAALRVDMRLEIAKLHKKLQTTMVYVTHDQVEAMTLADKIVVLRDGLVMQVGTPRELYQTPDNLFVAQFIGSPKMNVMPCKSEGNLFQLPSQGSGHFCQNIESTPLTKLGIRPEHISICKNQTPTCTGVIEVSEYLGSDTFLYVKCEGLGTLTVRTDGTQSLSVGNTVDLIFDEPHIHFFSLDDRAILNNYTF